MKFQFIVFQNDKAIAGFNSFASAVDYKNMMRRLNRSAGYKDHFHIIDTTKEE